MNRAYTPAMASQDYNRGRAIRGVPWLAAVICLVALVAGQHDIIQLVLIALGAAALGCACILLYELLDRF